MAITRKKPFKILPIAISDVGSTVYIPTRAHATDAGLDLYSPKSVTIDPLSAVTIDTGIHVAIPEGYFGEIKSRSSMLKRMIITDGTIDAGYTGPITIVLMNLGMYPCEINEGDRIAQLVIQPIVTPGLSIVEFLDETDRGEGGFGSTGV